MTHLGDLDGMTDCPVCFEEYDESGDCVPRLLHCSHTICDKCARELQQGNSLRCPECRVENVTGRGVKTFLKNEYIVTFLKRKRKRPKLMEEEPVQMKQCRNHGKEMNLFCTESLCNEPVCSLCLSYDHRCHHVMDLKLHQTMQSIADFYPGVVTKCPDCFKTYEEVGDQVPRLLPCTHTVCDKCTRKLLQGNSLSCPECHKKHVILKDDKIFPQNKYIITMIQERQRLKLEELEQYGNNFSMDFDQWKTDTCVKHGRELTLYCAEYLCRESICSVCLTMDHKCHRVVDVKIHKQTEFSSETDLSAWHYIKWS